MVLIGGPDEVSALLGDNRENLRGIESQRNRAAQQAWKTAYILGHFHKILQLLAVDEDGPFQTVIYVRAQHFVTIVNKFGIHQPKPFLRW
jgi:hypothetical protein